MTASLDRLLYRLRDAPPDRALDDLAPRVLGQIEAARPIAPMHLWGLRAALVALVAGSGVVVTASAGAASDRESSPFSAWSQLAPSRLLDDGH